jgi:hypothetical protein
MGVASAGGPSAAGIDAAAAYKAQDAGTWQQRRTNTPQDRGTQAEKGRRKRDVTGTSRNGFAIFMTAPFRKVLLRIYERKDINSVTLKMKRTLKWRVSEHESMD